MNRLAHGIVLRRFSITARVAAVSDPFKGTGVTIAYRFFLDV